MKTVSKKLIVRIVAYGVIISLLIAVLYRFPGYQKYYPFNIETIGYVIILFTGFTLRYLGSNLLEYDGYKKYQPLIISLALLSIGIGLFKILEIVDLPSSVDHMTEYVRIVSILILAAMTTLTITNLFAYGEYIDKFKFSRLLESVVDSQIVIVVIVCLFILYLIYLRGVLQESIGKIHYLDWGLTALFGILLIQRFYTGIKKRVDYDDRFELGEKHTQSIDELEDQKLNSFEEMQKEFVEDGRKEYLLTYLFNLLIHKSGRISSRKVSRILKPLIYYSDRPKPVLNFGWWKERISKNNEGRREEILREVTRNIQDNIGINMIDMNEEEEEST